MNVYNIAKWITIAVILVCLLLILFKPQIKKWMFGSLSDGFTNGSDNEIDTTGETPDDEDLLETTIAGTTTTTAGTTTTTAGTTTITKPILGITGDFTNYPYVMAGYNPLLDIVMTRIILLQVWNNDIAELQKTGLPRATNTADQQQDITKLGQNIEPFEDMTTGNTLYPQIYSTFEEFFTSEFQNIPRLNIFIPKPASHITSNNITREMTIILSTFAKPNWTTKIIKFYSADKVDNQTLDEFINDLSDEPAQNIEGNSSNLVMNNEISGLSTITMPINLRSKVDKVQTVFSKYVFNLQSGTELDIAPGFNEEMLGILKFIVNNPVLVPLLYTNLTDDDTMEMLDLDMASGSIGSSDAGSENIFEKDNQLKPTIVSDNTRRVGALGFADILGYGTSIAYNITLLADSEQRLPNGNRGTSLLKEQTELIQKLARQAILQNPNIGMSIPNKFVSDEKITLITDNIYSYYFDINTKYSKKYGEAFTKSGIFEFRLKPHLLPLYTDPLLFYNLLANKENALKSELNNNNTKLALEKEIDAIRQNIMVIEKTTPYMIYLPIYDFQYIKIIPRITKGELPVPNKFLYPSTLNRVMFNSRRNRSSIISNLFAKVGGRKLFGKKSNRNFKKSKRRKW